MTHLTPWEQSLRQRLDKHETAPPPEGWKRLYQSLETRTTGAMPSVTPHPVRRRGIRPAWVVTVLTAAACAALVWVLLPVEEDPHSTMAVTSALPSTPAVTSGHLARSVAALAETSGHQDAGRPVGDTKAWPKEETSTVGELTPDTAMAAVPMVAALYAKATDDTPECTADSVVAAAMAEEARPQRKLGATDRTLTPTRHHAVFVRRTTGKKLHAPLSLALHTTATGGGSTGSNRGGYYALSAPLSGTLSNKGVTGGTSADAEMGNAVQTSPGMPPDEPDWLLVGNAQREVGSHIRHKYPVRFGVSLHIPLTHRWGLTTGLTYTRLATDITSGSDMAYYQIEQRLRYIGIPLNVQYTMFDSRLFTAYLGAGGEIEKCVSGTRTTTCHDGSTSPFAVADENDLGRGLWQSSLGTSLGLQLNILPALGLYLEPGLTWYAPDGSSLPSIRHDHPWQFTLQAGLRLSPWR